MTSLLNRILSRRSFIAGLPLVAGGAIAHKQRASGAAQISLAGDCSVEPALQYLLDFNTLNFTALPVWGSGTLEPDFDWVPVQTPEIGILMIPPNWSVVHQFAHEFDRDGVPIWTESQLPYPFWTTTMFVSPDDLVAYIFVRGAIDNVQLLPADGADLMRHIVMDPVVRPENLCMAEHTDLSGEIGTGNWVSGDRYDHELLLSRGTVLVSPVAGPSLGPGTTFFFEAFVAPTEIAAELTLDVYLKILYQQLPKGGDGEPTPTPSPTP